MNDNNDNIQNTSDPVNDQDQNQQQEQPQQPISTGSPESAPIPVAKGESSGEKVEYGYEAIKQIESAPESSTAETASEKGESQPKPKQPNQAKQQQKADEEALAPKPVTPEIPRFYGYQIAPNFMNNLGDLRRQKKSNDSHDAGRWVVVLLERMLKKQQKAN